MSELSLVVLTISKFIPLTSSFEQPQQVTLSQFINRQPPFALKQLQRAVADVTLDSLPTTPSAAIDAIVEHFNTRHVIYRGLLFCISLLVSLVVFKVLASRLSFLYVEIGSQARIVQLRLMEFPTPIVAMAL